MAELTKEVDRHREIINGILPAYVRIRETVDRLEAEVGRLRTKVRDQDQVIARHRHIIEIINDRYHELRARVDGDEEEDDEEATPEFIRPEEYEPVNFGADTAEPMDLKADDDISEVLPDNPREVVVRPGEVMPDEDRSEEVRPKVVRPIESYFYKKKNEKPVERPNDVLPDNGSPATMPVERGQLTGLTDLADSPDVTGISLPSVSQVPSHSKEKLKCQLNRLCNPKCRLHPRQTLRYSLRHLLHRKKRPRRPNHISWCPKKVCRLKGIHPAHQFPRFPSP
jgi:hypothetical protein